MYMRCNCFSHQAFGLVTFSLPLPSWFPLRSLFTRGRNLSKFLRETRGWSVVRVWTRGIRVRGREKVKKSERVCQKRRKAKFDGWRFGDKKSDAPDNQLVVSPFSCSSLLCHFSLDSAWENPTIFLFSFHVKIKYVRLNAVNYIGRAKSHPWLPQRTLWFHRLQSVFCTFQAQSEPLVEFYNVQEPQELSLKLENNSLFFPIPNISNALCSPSKILHQLLLWNALWNMQSSQEHLKLIVHGKIGRQA